MEELAPAVGDPGREEEMGKSVLATGNLGEGEKTGEPVLVVALLLSWSDC